MRFSARILAPPLVCILLAAAATAAHAAPDCPTDRSPAAPGTLLERIAEQRVVCVGVRNNLAPFAAKSSSSDTFEGFDVELVRLVHKLIETRVDQPVKLLLVGFDRPDQVLAAVKSGWLDFAAAAITRTRERDLTGVDFSVDYFLDRQELVVPKAGLQDLSKATIGILKGSTAELKWAYRYPEVKRLACETHAACVEALKSGKVTAYGGDRAILLQRLADAGAGTDFALSNRAEFGDFEDTFWMEPYAMVLPENQSHLRDALNEAVDTAWSEDLMDGLFNRYFGPDSSFKGAITYDLPHVPATHVPEIAPEQPGAAPQLPAGS